MASSAGHIHNVFKSFRSRATAWACIGLKYLCSPESVRSWSGARKDASPPVPLKASKPGSKALGCLAINIALDSSNPTEARSAQIQSVPLLPPEAFSEYVAHTKHIAVNKVVLCEVPFCVHIVDLPIKAVELNIGKFAGIQKCLYRPTNVWAWVALALLQNPAEKRPEGGVPAQDPVVGDQGLVCKVLVWVNQMTLGQDCKQHFIGTPAIALAPHRPCIRRPQAVQ